MKAIAVHNFGYVEVDGQDAIKVLNGLCTADLNKLGTNQVAEAFFTDDRGWVSEYVLVAREEKGAALLGLIGDAPKLVAHVDRFIFREDATPRDRSGQYVAWIVTGSGISEQFSKWFGRDCSSARERTLERIEWDGKSLLLADCLHCYTQAYLLAAPLSELQSLEKAFEDHGIELYRSEQDFEALRIENYWPMVGREILEKTLPQELNRDDRAVSFTKGCYLGQETVARLDALGQVQRKLCLLELDGESCWTKEKLPPTREIYSGEKVVGNVTSPPSQSSSRVLALGMVRRGSFSLGTKLRWGDFTVTVVPHG